MSIREANFIVTDVETTGSHSEKNRITEVGCVNINNGEINEKYTSLINPHQFIPQYIANMTGISNEMAFRAPEASLIIPEVRAFFEKDKPVFVAHNVKFDWGFIQATLKRESVPELDIPMLCTLKLARKMLPKGIKKNVGALADYFGITVKGRHRALGDAEATAYILIELLEILEHDHDIHDLNELLEFQNKSYRNYRIGINAVEKFRNYSNHAPASPGLLYFNNNSGKTLYLRQTDNIKLKLTELADAGKVASKKLAEIISEANMLDWQTTPNVLSSHVLFSRELYRQQPQYNPAISKRLKYISFSNDDFPRIVKRSEFDSDALACFGPFESNYAMDLTIDNINKKFKLRECDFLLDPNPNFKECYFYDMNRCNAPCSLKQSKDQYAQEVNKVVKYMSSTLNSRKLQENIEVLIKTNTNNEDLKQQILKMNSELRNGNNTVQENTNLIYIEPDHNDINVIEVFFIRKGRLESSLSMGRKATVDILIDSIDHIFFNGSDDNYIPRESDNEEFSILSKWISKNDEQSIIVSANNREKEELLNELSHKIKHLEY